MGGAGAQALGSLPAAFLGALAETRLEIEWAELKSILRYGMTALQVGA